MARKFGAKKAVAKQPEWQPPKKVVLLSGGNPQIPMGYGEAPVAAYINAMPGWKQTIGTELDAIICRTFPKAAKAVKWNSPFYGFGDETWFLNFHCFDKYVKVAFLRGDGLDPQPPGSSKHKHVRYLDIREDGFDEKRFAAWVRQASKLQGEKM